MKRRDFLAVGGGVVAAQLASRSFAGLGDQFFKGPLRVESAFDLFDPWNRQVVTALGGVTPRVTPELLTTPLEKFEGYLNSQVNTDFAFVNTAMWEHSHMFANLFSWVPFGHSVAQHQNWLAHEGQALMDQYFAQFGLKAFAMGATGGISGLWTQGASTSLESLKGGQVYARSMVREVFRHFGLHGWQMGVAQRALEVKQGFRVAGGLSSARQALHQGDLAVLDWVSPHRDLRDGIPQSKVGYVTFEADPAQRPAVFFLGITTLTKWESLKARESEIRALANQVIGDSQKRWVSLDEQAVEVLRASGITVAPFVESDVQRMKDFSREVVGAHAHTALEQRIWSSYLKIG